MGFLASFPCKNDKKEMKKSEIMMNKTHKNFLEFGVSTLHNGAKKERLVLAYSFRRSESVMSGKACGVHGDGNMWQRLLI